MYEIVRLSDGWIFGECVSKSVADYLALQYSIVRRTPFVVVKCPAST